MCTVGSWSKAWQDFLALADVKHSMTVQLMFVSGITVLSKIFPFGFLANSEVVWPESSRDTCVGWGVDVLQLHIPVTWHIDSHVPPTCWLWWQPCGLLPCEPLSGWSFQGVVGSQGCPGLRCRDRCGIMQWPQPSVLASGHWGLLDQGHAGSRAGLDPCVFTPLWWEYFRVNVPSHVWRKTVLPSSENELPLPDHHY